MSNTKMTKDVVPQDFTLGLAIVDAIPVLFFCASVIAIGMVLMLVSLLVNRSRIDGNALWSAVTSMPSLACFIVGIIGMVLMSVFAVKLDSSDVKSNWIEQLTNGIAQAAFFVGILFLLKY